MQFFGFKPERASLRFQFRYCSKDHPEKVLGFARLLSGSSRTTAVVPPFQNASSISSRVPSDFVIPSSFAIRAWSFISSTEKEDAR